MTSTAASPKFKIDYCKKTPKDLEPLVEDCKTIGIDQLQQYNPLYDDFFVLTGDNYNTISLNHPYHAVNSNRVIHIVTKEEKAVPVHFKFSPLLDPIRYLIGKYDVKDARVRTLPKYDSKETSIDKLTKPNNASYIDNFFCYLSSQLLNVHGVKHGINYYGSYLGIQENYKIDIVEDVDYLNQSRFFTDNKGILYDIDATHFTNNYGSRGNKHKLQISALEGDDADILLDFEDVVVEVEGVAGISESCPTEDLVLDELENVYDKHRRSGANSADGDGEGDDSDNSSNNSDINYSSDEDGDDEGSELDEGSGSGSEHDSDFEDMDTDEDTDTDEDEDQDDNLEEESLYAYIKNFPVQMICLEKCEGTLDELFIRKVINPENAASVFMQVIMSLIVYQKMFSMTHNDLHTNNIMYVSTDEPFLYYQYEGNIYKVPTYGKIYKIIDFGRAIYKYRGKVFCSDSFAQDGDASTQYNCEPFFNKKKPRLDPNMSFDLCRLGCSIYDFLIRDNDNDGPTDDLQATILRWCEDDNGKNVLYKKTGEERYPNFKLYKMIARTVHRHTPEAQLAFPYFAQFQTRIVDADADILDIDALPSYAGAADTSN